MGVKGRLGERDSGKKFQDEKELYVVVKQFSCIDGRDLWEREERVLGQGGKLSGI